MNASKKNIRIWPVEIEKDWIWFSDVFLGGLYRYNLLTKEIVCEIQPATLYHLNIFRVGGIIFWKEYVIICPVYVCDPIAIYCRQTGKLNTVNIAAIEEKLYLDRAIKINGYLYLNVYCSNIAVIIIKMDKLDDNMGKDIIPKILFYPDNKPHIVWFAKYYYGAIYLPACDEKIIYKLENNKISTIVVDIPQNILTMCFYKKEAWIVSSSGKEIYQIDLNGRCLKSISVENIECFSEKQKIYNIIVTENYIFFLFREKSFGYYDRKKEFGYGLDLSPENSENLYKDKLPGLFLASIEKNNRLFLLPYGNKGIEIDLSTLKCKVMNVFFPKEMDENKIEYYTEIAQAHNGGVEFREINANSLYAYLNYPTINCTWSILNNYTKRSVGRKIYQAYF